LTGSGEEKSSGEQQLWPFAARLMMEKSQKGEADQMYPDKLPEASCDRVSQIPALGGFGGYYPVWLSTTTVFQGSSRGPKHSS